MVDAPRGRIALLTLVAACSGDGLATTTMPVNERSAPVEVRVAPVPQTISLAAAWVDAHGHGWAVGDYGTVLETSRGGVRWSHWRPIDVGTRVNLHDLAVQGDDLAVAVGERGTVLRRIAGTWRSEVIQDPDARLHAGSPSLLRVALAATATRGTAACIVSDRGLFSTAEVRMAGFEHAALPFALPDTPGFDVAAGPDGACWLLAYDWVSPDRRRIWRLDPRGRRWEELGFPAGLPPPTTSFHAVWLASSDAKPRVVAGLGPDDHRIYEWNDQPRGWVALNEASPAGALAATAILTGSTSLLWAVDGTTVHRIDPDTAARSSDLAARIRGARALDQLEHFSARDLAVSQDGTIWVAGTRWQHHDLRSVVARSHDRGATWTFDELPANGGLLLSIAIARDGRRGWLLDDSGRILRLASSTWTEYRKVDRTVRQIVSTRGGDQAWLFGVDGVHRLADGAVTRLWQLFDDERISYLHVCDQELHSWMRDRSSWYSFDGAQFQREWARQLPGCPEDACRELDLTVDPQLAACSADGQIWSLAANTGYSVDARQSWKRWVAAELDGRSRALAALPGAAAADVVLAFVSLAGTVFVATADPERSQPAVTNLMARQADKVTRISWRLGPAGLKPAYDQHRDQFVVQACYEGDDACRAHGSWSDQKLDLRFDGKDSFETRQTVEQEAGTHVSWRLIASLDGVRRKPIFIGTTQVGKTLRQRLWENAWIPLVGLAGWAVLVGGFLLCWPPALVSIADHAARFENIKALGALVSILSFLLGAWVVNRGRVVRKWGEHHLKPGGKHFTAIATVRIRDQYMRRTECQDRWIELHLDTARRRLLDSAFFAGRPEQGQLAVQVKHEEHAAQDHEAFTATDLDALLSAGSRATICVVDSTSRAGAEIARWAVGNATKPRIVVLCDEESTTGAAQLVLQRLQEVTDEPQIDQALLLALLETGRVVPFFENLSQREPGTKAAIRAFLAETRVALAIITSRDRPAPFGGKNIVIEPKPGDGATG